MYSFQKKGLWQKQIPTALGLLLLVGSLATGIIFFGQGTGVFAPRATPQTTPKEYQVSNVTDSSFTVSFYTDEETVAFVKYGDQADKITSQASDERDQLAGSVGKYRLHQISVRGLQPNTSYYYVLGTGSKAEFDNDGQPFTVKTALKPTGPAPAARTIYGSISQAGGTPAEGAIIFLRSPKIGQMSSLVKSSGSWAVALSKAMTADGQGYAQLEEIDELEVFVQGTNLKDTAQTKLVIKDAQPFPEISLNGTDQTVAVSQKSVAASGSASLDQITPSPVVTSSGSAQLITNGANSLSTEPAVASDGADIRGKLQELLAESDAADSTASAVLMVGETTSSGVETEEAMIVTEKPIVKGKVKPNVQVKIEIHSDNQIETTVAADAQGEFELDLAALKQSLEPGEHTITYSYLDPDTNQEVTKTETFYVEDTSNQLADASLTGSSLALAGTATPTPTKKLTVTPSPTSSIPYGSGNPYSLTVTPTKSASLSATPVATSSASRSAQVATNSAMYKSGSVGMTLALVVGGLFLIFAGSWSWWLAAELKEEEG